MLYETLKPLKEYFNQALKAGGTTTAPLLEWGNIALADDANLNEQIVMTLVNLGEEKTLKNGRNVTEIGGKTLYHNRYWYFNLHLLFSVRFNDYDTSMKNLSLLLQFFQRNRVFTKENLPTLPNNADRLVFELVDLNLDQINQIWMVLGGKHYPFLLFKVQMVTVGELPVSEAPMITRIISNEDNVVS